jgi:hypothetical protein
MNNGAFIFQKNIFSISEIENISTIAREFEREKNSVHSNGKYADLNWFKVDLSQDLDFCRKILDALRVKNPVMLVFYYLDPGAKLHLHRDLTGASLNNRIRFHVPIITNEYVNFIVDNTEIKMAPGDLWCLDTSYLHAVENMGFESRVHIVIECDINDEIKSKLPRGLDVSIHNISYIFILIISFIKAIFINSLKNPKYFKDQMFMVYRFLIWRLFGNSDKK